MMTIETAAKRYLQIKELEAGIAAAEDGIAKVQKEMDDAEDRLREIRKTKNDLMKELRAAARDEGQLPLFDLPAVLSVARAGHEVR